jgi:predicted nucleic-acid-binding Zn-ribbon protein
MNTSYTCPKCNGRAFETSEFRATGGMLTKLFDIQTKRFTTVSCTNCKFTELYKGDQKTLGHIFDFMVSNG